MSGLDTSLSDPELAGLPENSPSSGGGPLRLLVVLALRADVLEGSHVGLAVGSQVFFVLPKVVGHFRGAPALCHLPLQVVCDVRQSFDLFLQVDNKVFHAVAADTAFGFGFSSLLCSHDCFLLLLGELLCDQGVFLLTFQLV